MQASNHSGPAPHVNPAFFGGAGASVPGQADPYGRPPNAQGSGSYGGGYEQRGAGLGSGGDAQLMMQISESEFEELMGKNRNVSSNAISRAVSDASAGKHFQKFHNELSSSSFFVPY